MKNRVWLFSMGILALFLASFLVLVLFGAQSYRAAVAGREANARRLALLAGLSAELRSFDRDGALTVSQTPDGPLLELADGDTGYVLRLYQRDGALLEEYAPAAAAPSPETAQVLGETDLFAVDLAPDGSLMITTDAGPVLFTPRSKGGTAP